MKIIETFGYHPGEGFRRLERHFQRMARSAEALGYVFDRAAAEDAMRIEGDAPLRCRLTLDAEGAFAFETTPFLPVTGTWRIEIAPERLESADPWLRHKTTQRAIYDRMRAELPDGIDERVLLNEAGHVCDGTITTVFADLGALLVTPPLSAGVLPGVLRAEMLESGQAVEDTLIPGDLADARELYVGNSLRGLIPADLVGYSAAS
ncbi:aminotransferase class IV family protein [Aliiroseovarius sp. YM-037]|uniref:aminotransferase class IV family protein n=1 Tax=Aliiroseovarius sp. YM-037 TaxID=3341728 RepID=UPI003A7FAF87